MVLRPGEHHYQPISWDGAYRADRRAAQCADNPDQAVFYTSGRTSNEAAFCYQLLVRSFGTNNLPDCSNMCHESSGSALTESIGIGKGSVTVDDVEHADLIVIAGQTRAPITRGCCRRWRRQRQTAQDHCGESAARGGI